MDDIAASDALICKGSWRLITHETWTATIEVQRSYDDKTTWKTVISRQSKDDTNLDVTGDETEVDDDVYYRVSVTADDAGDTGSYEFYVDPYVQNGVVEITGYTSATVVTGTVKVRVGSTDATYEWAEGAWSDVNGWPSAMPTFYEDRLVTGGTDEQPQTSWLTETADYDDYEVHSPILDSDPITATLNARQVNKIKAFVALNHLLAFTGGSIWKICAGYNSDVLSPSSIQQKPQEYRGISDVDPLIVGETCLYVQEHGCKVRDLAYTYEVDGYRGNDLSVMATHLFDGYEIVDWDYQAIPDSIVWCARDDGVLLGLTYMREHEVWGWHKHVTSTSAGDSEVESVCCIGGDDSDEVWMVVKRTVDSSTVRYIERMLPRVTSALEDCWYVDAGKEYTSNGSATVTGLSHLEGESVCGIADGVVFTGNTVSSGSITLGASADHIIVGLPIEYPDLETLDLELGLKNGSSQGSKMRVSRVFIRVLNTAGGTVGPDSSNLTETLCDTDELTTDVQEVMLQSDYSTDGRVFIRQTYPLPITILSIVPGVDYGGH